MFLKYFVNILVLYFCVSIKSVEHIEKIDDVINVETIVDALNDEKVFDENCINEHEMCNEWALSDECVSNPNFMLSKCKESCKVCESKRCNDLMGSKCNEILETQNCYETGIKDKCRWSCSACFLEQGNKMCIRDKNEKPSAQFNFLDSLFEKFSNKENVKIHNRDPLVVTIDDFASNSDCDNILNTIKTSDWSTSLAGDGKHSARTSSTYWCVSKECKEATKNLRDNIEKYTGFKDEYAEQLQVLRYNNHEFYKSHNDQNSPRASAWGPRIYTILFYLSDVDSGGETKFTDLNITITPKKGRVLMWPSVLNENPNKRDFRTDHESLKVVQGVKYAANYWIHLYKYKKYHYCENKPYLENWY